MLDSACVVGFVDAQNPRHKVLIGVSLLLSRGD